jgi:tRNA A-37 threonylcarbamoyl transferase component Bud32
MWIATANLGGKLDAMLAAGEFVAIASQSGQDDATAFARGVALSNLGRLGEARDAFATLADSTNFADAAAVERGFLDLNTPEGPAAVAAAMHDLAPRAAGVLAGRAQHLLGAAEFRQMHIGDALDALARAQKAYHEIACEPGEAQVLDTQGMVHQWMGNESAALVSYAHSLALKNRIGDRVGAAITLGNLGRYCAMLGRPEEARAFLGLDLKVAEDVGDVRGQARVLTDLAEIAREAGDLKTSTENLVRAESLAKGANLRQIEFEAQLGRALTAHASKDTNAARVALEAARATVGKAPTDFDRFLMDWAGAKIEADSTEAIRLLNEAVEGFRNADFPALEIDARLDLAQLYIASGKVGEAERETLLSLKRARERGLPRYRVRIGELMERLSLTEGVAEESGKPIEDRPSSTADGYLIRERLGGGTFATVYRAFDVERAREVALKVLDMEGRYAQPERDRLLDSARLDIEAANRARHPGLVTVYAIGRDARGNVYLAEELITGTDLREKLNGTPARDARSVCGTLGDVAEALAALHTAGVVHRDMKPENIMLRPDGSPVIVDFGIAHIAGLAEKPGSVSRGSPEYFSPEQAQGAEPKPSDDMYSFGVILWEWLKGTRPTGAIARKSSFFGGRSEPKNADDLAAALLAQKGDERPTADAAARLLRSFAA